jgi:hypothetical protein
MHDLRPHCLSCIVCSVCLGEYEEGEMLRALLPCEHAFHAVSTGGYLFVQSFAVSVSAYD